MEGRLLIAFISFNAIKPVRVSPAFFVPTERVVLISKDNNYGRLAHHDAEAQ